MQEESILWQGKPAWKGYSLQIALLVLFSLTLTFLPLTIPLFITLFFYRAQFDFKVTDQRIIAKKGLIGKRTGELDIKDIRSINVNQSISQRIFNLGTLEFTTASGPIKEVQLIHVQEPEALKEMIRKCKLDREKVA